MISWFNYTMIKFILIFLLFSSTFAINHNEYKICQKRLNVPRNFPECQQIFCGYELNLSSQKNISNYNVLDCHYTLTQIFVEGSGPQFCNECEQKVKYSAIVWNLINETEPTQYLKLG